MTLGDIVTLAVIQGLTEFLPVSSSGHLVLGQHLLGVQAPGVALEVALHLGTLISVAIVFAKDIKQLLMACFSFVRPMSNGGQTAQVKLYRRLVLLLVLASVPTGVIGIAFKDLFIALFASPRFVALALMITGIMLLVVSRMQGTKTLQHMRIRDALAVGLAQGLAITPGISRSGLTISTGLLLGYDRETATRFSFLLSIPAIVGASVLEAPSLLGAQLNFPLWWMVVGVLVAALTGVVAILGLVQMLKRGKLSYFAYYVWAVGILTMLLVR
ncbi:MAG: Undecaprenyl-diphosphatase [Firmicutes bacterium]|nr:Undecaprenyl-diphosphatase [candidate division NPL-UPA2 bacterium]